MLPWILRLNGVMDFGMLVRAMLIGLFGASQIRLHDGVCKSSEIVGNKGLPEEYC